MPKTETRPPSQPAPHEGMTKVRAPDMEVVTKGWWTLRVERKSADELEAESRARRARA